MFLSAYFCFDFPHLIKFIYNFQVGTWKWRHTKYLQLILKLKFKWVEIMNCILVCMIFNYSIRDLFKKLSK